MAAKGDGGTQERMACIVGEQSDKARIGQCLPGGPGESSVS